MNPFSKLLRAWKSYRLKTSSNEQFIAHLRSLGMQIGEGCRVLDRNIGSEPFLVRIGNHVTITSGTRLITHDGGIWIYRDVDPAINRFGPIDIEDNVFVGINSIIMPGVTIGRDSIVAAGSVVTKDVPPGSIVGGVPARLISTADQYLEKVRADQLPVSDEERRRIAAGESQTRVMKPTIMKHLGWEAWDRKKARQSQGDQT